MRLRAVGAHRPPRPGPPRSSHRIPGSALPLVANQRRQRWPSSPRRAVATGEGRLFAVAVLQSPLDPCLPVVLRLIAIKNLRCGSQTINPFPGSLFASTCLLHSPSNTTIIIQHTAYSNSGGWPPESQPPACPSTKSARTAATLPRLARDGR